MFAFRVSSLPCWVRSVTRAPLARAHGRPGRRLVADVNRGPGPRHRRLRHRDHDHQGPGLAHTNSSAATTAAATAPPRTSRRHGRALLTGGGVGRRQDPCFETGGQARTQAPPIGSRAPVPGSEGESPRPSLASADVSSCPRGSPSSASTRRSNCSALRTRQARVPRGIERARGGFLVGQLLPVQQHHRLPVLLGKPGHRLPERAERQAVLTAGVEPGGEGPFGHRLQAGRIGAPPALSQVRSVRRPVDPARIFSGSRREARLRQAARKVSCAASSAAASLRPSFRK